MHVQTQNERLKACIDKNTTTFHAPWLQLVVIFPFKIYQQSLQELQLVKWVLYLHRMKNTVWMQSTLSSICMYKMRF